MLDIGWSEMLVIAVVLIVIVGPKDLPQMLRSLGRMTTKMRGMANDFQKQFNEALKEAELDDVKKTVDSLRSLNPAAEIRKQLNPFEKAASDVKASLDEVAKPKATPVPAKTAPVESDVASSLPAEGTKPPAQPKAARSAAGKTKKSVADKAKSTTAKAGDKVVTAFKPAKTAGPAKTSSAKPSPVKKVTGAAKPKAVPVKTAEDKPAAARPRRPRTARKTTRTPN